MKIDDIDTRDLPPELQNYIDQNQVIVNYGKYQTSVVVSDSKPGWTGRLGETTFIFNGTAGYLYVCSTDNSTTWVLVTSWWMT